MLTDLYAVLCQKVPQDGAALFGLPVAPDHSLWLAIDASAFPVLLLPARKDDLRPDIALRAVDALFSRDCVIDTEGAKSRNGCYSIIRLKENDPEIVRLFLKILEERFCIQNPPSNNAAIAANIQEVAALFSRVEFNTPDLIGLWGELHVISRSENVDAAVRCWSRQKTAKFDFVSKDFVLDVKTTLAASPKHRFSLEQLRPMGELDAFIVSLCVIEVQSGQTVWALMETIAARIADQDLRSVFLTQCLAKGGSDLYRSEMALRSYPDDDTLALFKARDIPAPQINEGDPIENVRFDVDLSRMIAIYPQAGQAILRFQKE